jgi:hypothetical protein
MLVRLRSERRSRLHARSLIPSFRTRSAVRNPGAAAASLAVGSGLIANVMPEMTKLVESAIGPRQTLNLR